MPSALVLGALVALIGCGGKPETKAPPGPRQPVPGERMRTTVESVRGGCESYREAVPEAYGFCLQRAAMTLGSVAEMTTVCTSAGEWENACRSQWVAAQVGMNRFDAQTLLEACGSAADCALQRLDDQPLADVILQIARCEKYAGEFAADCAGHALQRWAAARPTAEDIARVMSQHGRYDVQIGTFVGMIVTCQQTVTCPEDDSLVGKACRQGAAAYAQNTRTCNGALPRGQ